MAETKPPADSGAIKFESSTLVRAKQNDKEAMAVMFKQFISADETVHTVEYLGTNGIWGLGTHSFGCLTNRRIAALKVGAFGEVVYQDGFLEYLNSMVVWQPGKLGLYVWSFILVLLAIPTFGIALLLFPIMVKTYYRFNKCGLVFIIRQGVSVYMFTNRKLLGRANSIYRDTVAIREGRFRDNMRSMHN